MEMFKGYSQTALPLYRRGLQCVPALGKRSFLKGWTRYGKEEIDRVEFAVLAAKYPECNTALVMGPYTPLLAIDIEIEKHEERIAEYNRAVEAFGSTPFVRYGGSGRMMLLYQKSAEADYLEHRGRPVELYCNSGMVILYGEHPDGGDLYRWPEGNPIDTWAHMAPEVSPDQIEAYFEGVPETFMAEKVKDAFDCYTEPVEAFVAEKVSEGLTCYVAEAIPTGEGTEIKDLAGLADYVFCKLFTAELEKFGITPGSPAGLRLVELAQEYVNWEVKS